MPADIASLAKPGGWRIGKWTGAGAKPLPASLKDSFEGRYTTLLIGWPRQGKGQACSMSWLDQNLVLHTIDGFAYNWERGSWVVEKVTLWGGEPYTVTLTVDGEGALTGQVINPNQGGSRGSGSLASDIGEEVVGTFTAQVNPSPPGWLLWLLRLLGSRA